MANEAAEERQAWDTEQGVADSSSPCAFLSSLSSVFKSLPKAIIEMDILPNELVCWYEAEEPTLGGVESYSK